MTLTETETRLAGAKVVIFFESSKKKEILGEK